MNYENERPIIGVLAQEVAYSLEQIYGRGTYDSYIAASYVKFLEGSGARVVPIRIGMPKKYYEDLLKKINGVLLPGGATWFDGQPKLGYADAGEHIFNVARALNDGGDHFPLWGTCLGFQLLAYLWLDIINPRVDCDSTNISSTLRFTDDVGNSNLYRYAPEDVMTTLSSTSSTFNYHRFCITQERYAEYEMQNDWRILSTSNDRGGREYVSSMESVRYPFYAVQFHPEKVIYEWTDRLVIPHSNSAVKANRYFADFFVSECRMSRHTFDNPNDEKTHLIYNYPVTHTGAQGNNFEQCYLFKYE